MKLLGRTTQPEDIDQCLHILRDRFLYDDEQLAHLPAMWLDLLSRDVARSAVVFDEAAPRRVLAFGIAAPLKHSRFAAVLRDRVAFIARTLLDEWSAGHEPFLDEPGFASANGCAGLNIFVLHNGVSETVPASAFPSVLSKMSETFVSQYVGCRLQAIAHESFGVPPEFAEDLGLQLVEYAPTQTRRLLDCPLNRKPSIFLMSRDQAERHPGNLTMNMLFLRFTPPVFSFNADKRNLLRFALEGESDRRIAELLRVAPRTLKKRWAEIYAARISDDIPRNCTPIPSSTCASEVRIPSRTRFDCPRQPKPKTVP